MLPYSISAKDNAFSIAVAQFVIDIFSSTWLLTMCIEGMNSGKAEDRCIFDISATSLSAL